ncbi:MAG: c-type cytochrome [Bacteroidetes bacterium]|nr:MAG: c-type cytochrome [Bacteroidota bacterium]
MKKKKKLCVTWIIVVGLTISVAATRPESGNREFKNLKVLPKDIQSKQLEQIMVDEFEEGLGVNCGYCHAEGEKAVSHRLDYASDEKPEKEIARRMMKLTMGLNKKYFHLKNPLIGDSLLIITCATCHRGNPHPDKESLK